MDIHTKRLQQQMHMMTFNHNSHRRWWNDQQFPGGTNEPQHSELFQCLDAEGTNRPSVPLFI